MRRSKEDANFMKRISVHAKYMPKRFWERTQDLLRLEKSTALVVSVAQLVARWTHDRKVVGSIPANAVCFTVVR